MLQIDTLFLAVVGAQRAACRCGSIRYDPIRPTSHSTERKRDVSHRLDFGEKKHR